MFVRAVAIVALLTAGCDRPHRIEREIDAILRSGAFHRIAATTVGGDSLELWHEPKDGDFRPFVIVARDHSGRLLDFCRGEFRSSTRPYCQGERYCTLVADNQEEGVSGSRNARDM